MIYLDLARHFLLGCAGALMGFYMTGTILFIFGGTVYRLAGMHFPDRRAALLIGLSSISGAFVGVSLSHLFVDGLL